MKSSVYCIQVIFLASKSSSPIELLMAVELLNLFFCWSVDVFKMSWKLFYHNAFVSIMNRTQNLKSCSIEAVCVWHSHSRWRQGRWKKPTSFWMVWRKYCGIDIEYMHQEWCQVPEERRFRRALKGHRAWITAKEQISLQVLEPILLLFK